MRARAYPRVHACACPAYPRARACPCARMRVWGAWLTRNQSSRWAGQQRPGAGTVMAVPSAPFGAASVPLWTPGPQTQSWRRSENEKDIRWSDSSGDGGVEWTSRTSCRLSPRPQFLLFSSDIWERSLETTTSAPRPISPVAGALRTTGHHTGQKSLPLLLLGGECGGQMR